ncbi:MAG TPA: ABC transporter substrate-binding protein [Acetobacteraceae bacterium]|nr:ABC transporter substrate-binding protein [Acetobacteraceae bacterium]
MRSLKLALGALFAAVLALALPARAEEQPRYGGTLTYMIPADAPPSLDLHREATYALVHAVAPFYSVLMRVNPDNPADTTKFVCDLCASIPTPTDGGTTYTFKIITGVTFHDGSPLTAADVATSWHEIIFPRPGVLSARANWYEVVKSVEAPDATTVVFRLKYPTTTFLPSLADPYAAIYPKAILDKDPHWFEQHVLGSGPFKFVSYDIGQEIKGVKNPDYYHKGLPYLDGFVGIFAEKQAVRVDAIRAGRAAMEFRGLPPAAINDLKRSLGDKLNVQYSDWNCGNLITPNSRRKPFDDVRVRKALLLAVDQWHGALALSKIANVKTVGGIAFPGSPLAATKAELEQMAGFWPDIEKSRAEARRLLQEAGQEHLHFELLNRNVDQPYKYVGTWLIDQWSKIGVTATQKVVPTGPWFQLMRTGNFDVVVEANCNSVVNPVLDTQKYLPHDVFVENYGGYSDPVEVDIYNKMLRATDPIVVRQLMRQYETRIVNDQAHEFPMLWWYRAIPERSYVHGWKIGPSHYINQDLSNIWLDNTATE